MRLSLFCCIFASAILLSCDDDSVNSIPASEPVVEKTVESSQVFVLQGLVDYKLGYNVFVPSDDFGKNIYLKDGSFCGSAYSFAISSANSFATMSVDECQSLSWMSSAPVCEGSLYWLRYVTPYVNSLVKVRVDFAQGNNVGIEYEIAQFEKIVNDQNVNANIFPRYKQAFNYCMPRISESNVYVEHFVSDAADTAVFNLAIEWDNAALGTNWVAYEFNPVTRVQKNISRSDSWFWDFDISSSELVLNSMHSSNGYDKGHLCAAKDRDYSEQAKKQTFNFANCFPQIGVNFNQGYWENLEQLFRGWCVSSQYDHVFVAKGGTLNSLLTNYKGEIPQVISSDFSVLPETDAKGYTAKGLPVPRYFFMAILTEKAGVYKSLGFYVEHKEYPTPAEKIYAAETFKADAVSIDKLEELTGIDFFCNLPDAIEDFVEADINLDAWEWTYVD